MVCVSAASNMHVYLLEKRVFLKQTTCPVFNHLSEQLLSEKHWKKTKFHLPKFFVHCGDCCVSFTQHGIVRTSVFYTVEYVSGQNKSFKGNVVLGTQFWSPQNRCVTIGVSPEISMCKYIHTYIHAYMHACM